MDKLEGYLKDVIDDMHATWSQYDQLACDGVKPCPIPFFGDIERARVLTVGVNPSAKEFSEKRNWPDAMTAIELKQRLIQYFQHGSVPSHKWFDTWSQALAPLGVSYQEGAAHVDLSPRATRSRIKADADLKLFAKMLAQDARWFFKLLPECSKAQLILFAGGLPDGNPLNKATKIFVAKYGFQFEGPPTPKIGIGKVGFYHLRGPGVDLPAFFCSVSPSARNPEILVQRVGEQKAKLLELMNAGANSVQL